jgi:hypothetical protein
MLKARAVDWTQVTMKDVEYALMVLINGRQRIGKKQRKAIPL